MGDLLVGAFLGWTSMCEAFSGQSLPALEEADFEKDPWFGFV